MVNGDRDGQRGCNNPLQADRHLKGSRHSKLPTIQSKSLLAAANRLARAAPSALAFASGLLRTMTLRWGLW